MKSYLLLPFVILMAGLPASLAQDSPAPTPASQTSPSPTPAASLSDGDSETPGSTVDKPADPSAATASPTSAQKPVDMFEQDYDETRDIFLVPGTQTPYSGPVYSTNDSGTGKDAVGTLKDGHEDGLWTKYYENGIKSEEGIYRNGNEVGTWKYWHDNGQLQAEGAYRDGVPIGRWKTYYETGKPETEGVFVDGQMEGDWKIWDEATGVMAIKKYKNGEPPEPIP